MRATPPNFLFGSDGELPPRELPLRICLEQSDCLIEGAITWLDVGMRPSRNYSLKLTPHCSEATEHWGSKISGVEPSGTLFDALNGRKILFDAEVRTKQKYYLLSTVEPSETRDVIVEPLMTQPPWRLYSVEANALTESAVKFFLRYGYRLTTKPLESRPIFPVFTLEAGCRAIRCRCRRSK